MFVQPAKKDKIDLNIAKCGWIFMQIQQNHFEKIFALGKYVGPKNLISSYTSFQAKKFNLSSSRRQKKRIHDPNVEERKINMRSEIFQSNI